MLPLELLILTLVGTAYGLSTNRVSKNLSHHDRQDRHDHVTGFIKKPVADIGSPKELKETQGKVVCDL